MPEPPKDTRPAPRRRTPPAKQPSRIEVYHAGARIAVRAVMEFATGASVDLIGAFDGFFDVGVIFCLLLRTTAVPERFDPIDHRESPSVTTISINALADAIDRPFETVRRHVRRLVATGWCVQTAAGISIPDAILHADRTQALLIRLHDRLVTQIAHLSALDYPLPAGPVEARRSEAAVLGAAIELMLKAIELGYDVYGGLLRLLISGALMTGNARPITTDSELTRLYSEALTPPPDAIRSPVTISGLARALSLPYPTVRRHVEQLIAEGRFQREPKGVLVTAAWIQDPVLLATGSRLIDRFDDMMRRLALAGFPFDHPARGYIGGPIAPVSFA